MRPAPSVPRVLRRELKRRDSRLSILWRMTVTVLLLSLGQGLQPAYSRGGVDYSSASVEPPQTCYVPTECARQYWKHVEVEELEKGYRCTVPTHSEPRLSTELNNEFVRVDPSPE